MDELVGVGSTSTMLAWVIDDALYPSGIGVDDLLVIDTALDPTPGDVVLVIYEGEHYLRRLAPRGQPPALFSDVPGIPPLLISDGQSVEIKGVVTWNLHRHPGAVVPAGLRDIDVPVRLDELIKAKACSTYLARASGKSMIDAGIRPGDILVVDRTCDPQPGHVVVAIVDGDFTVKRLGGDNGFAQLDPANPEYTSIALKAEDEPELWGTVTWNLQRIAQR